MNVTIVDVNDETPKPSQPLFIFEVSEGVRSSTPIGRVLAEDADCCDDIRYSFEQSQPYFSIDQYTGGITLTDQLLDREQLTELSLIVKLDDGVHTGRAHVLVNVLDVNDNAPVFTEDTYEMTATEASARFVLFLFSFSYLQIKYRNF